MVLNPHHQNQMGTELINPYICTFRYRKVIGIKESFEKYVKKFEDASSAYFPPPPKLFPANVILQTQI